MNNPFFTFFLNAQQVNSVKNEEDKIFLIVLLSISLYQCIDMSFGIYHIDLTNNANHSIGYYFTLGGKYGTHYPDTLLPTTNEYIMYDISKVLSPGCEFHGKLEEIFAQFPKDTMSVFIFHTDMLNTYAWEDVRDNYLILRRYDLSLSDLNILHNKYGVPEIPYPPDERMRNMKMYPPYEEIK